MDHRSGELYTKGVMTAKRALRHCLVFVVSPSGCRIAQRRLAEKRNRARWRPGRKTPGESDRYLMRGWEGV